MNLKQYEQLVEMVPDGVIVVNDAGKIVLINQQAEKLFNYQKDDLLGKKIETLIPEGALPKFNKQWSLYKKDPLIRHLGAIEEVTGKRKNGEIFPADISLNPVKLPEGFFIASFVRDITERKQKEKVLQEREARYRTLFDQSLDAIFVVDRSTMKIILCNQRATDQTGWSVNELIGKSFFELIPKSTYEKHFSKLSRLAIGKTRQFTASQNKKNGTVYPAELSAGRILIGNQEIFQVYVKDLSDIEFKEKEVKRLASFPQENPGLILEVNEKGVLTYINPAGKVLMEKMEIKDNDLQRFLPENYHTLVKECIKTGTGLSPVETVVNDRVLLWRGHPVQASRTVNFYAMDITSSKLSERVIRQQTQDLSIICTINRAVNHEATMKEVINLINREIKKAFNSTGVTIYLLSNNEQYLEMQNLSLSKSITNRIEKLVGREIPAVKIPLINGSIYKGIMENKEGLQIVNDPDAILQLMSEFVPNIAKRGSKLYNSVSKILPQILKILNINSVIHFPIVFQGKTIGIIDIASEDPLGDTDLDRYKIFVEELSSIISYKKMEDKLKENEVYYRSLINNMHEDILVIDRDYRIKDINNQFLVSSKLNKKEVINSTCYEISHRYDRPCDQMGEKCGLIDVFNTGKHHNQLHEHYRADGSKCYVDILFSPLRNLDGEITHVIESVRDVTELISTRDLLQESEKRFKSIANSALEAIICTDRKGGITYWNDAAQRMFGYGKKEVLGKNFALLLTDRDWYRYKKSINSFVETGQGEIVGKTAKLTGLRKNGLEFPLEISVSSWELDDAIYFSAIIRDITERVVRNQTLENALNEARQANRVKDLFLANMSHEIRTPLNGILGFSQLLKEKCQRQDLEDEENKIFFDMVDSSGKRLVRTVHEILDLSQIESGVYKYREELFDLIKLVNLIVAELRLSAEEKSLDVEVSHEKRELFISADKYTISQAISNLIDNAIKYTEKGRVSISSCRVNEQYELKIKDTGIGIAKDYMERMFDTFTQESEGYSKAYQGIGLGLSIVKRGLDLNKVKIEVESQKGVGTTVILTFQPATEKAIPEKNETVKKQSGISLKPGAQKRSILVVEDDLNTQKLLKFFLQDIGTLHFAESVDEAKERILTINVDLVLLDLSLKGEEDGLDFVKYIRKRDNLKQLPVIANSAHAFTTDRERCLTAGCDDYLSKPVNKYDLVKKINQYLYPH